MAQRVVLHIGAMKSGTTFIQHTLRTNRDVLREHDVLFPGRTIGDQVRAVRDLIDPRRPVEQPLDPQGPWLRLVEEIREWPGTAVVSMEYLGPRRRPRIDLALSSFAGSTVDVVLTARDLGRTVPSMWTESVQNRAVLSWDDYLAAIRGEDEDAASPAVVAARRAFWRQQDLAAIARRWVAAVGRDHFTLITVPPAGSPPDLLWSRFAQVLGVPAGVCDLGVTRNPSLDAASALVLRALNERLESAGLPPGEYEDIVKRGLAKEGLARRAGRGRPAALSARWLRRRSRAEVAALAALDLHVIGSLDELRATAVDGVDPAKVGAEEQLEAALDGLASLVLAWAAEHGAD